MPIAICPNCDQKLRCTEGAGRVRCPKCMATVDKPPPEDAWFFEGMKEDGAAEDEKVIEERPAELPPPAPTYSPSAPPLEPDIVASLGWFCFLDSWLVVGLYLIVLLGGDSVLALAAIGATAAGLFACVLTFFLALPRAFARRDWVSVASVVSAVVHYPFFAFMVWLLLTMTAISARLAEVYQALPRR